jgi:hypothetical protein
LYVTSKVAFQAELVDSDMCLGSSLNVEIGSRKANPHTQQSQSQDRSLDLLDLMNESDQFGGMDQQGLFLQHQWQHDLAGIGGVFG